MRLRLAALAAAPALLSLAIVTPARAAVTQPAGSICGWLAFAEEGDWTVVFDAGPLRLVDEDDPTAVHTGTVTCTIQDGVRAHSGADWVSVTGDPAPTHAVLPPTAVAAPGELPWTMFVCTRLDVDGTPLYWHDPDDRNQDGWWTTSASANCANTSETADVRVGQDPPSRQVFSAIATAQGELDALPGASGTSTDSTISIVRLPGDVAVLRTAPAGWTCTDVHSGLPVAVRGVLATPDPGVSCAPPTGSGLACWRTDVSGYLVPAVLGRVEVSSTCGNIAVTRWLTPVQGTAVQPFSSAFGWSQAPPVTCTASEDTTPVDESAYTVVCGVFTL